MTMYAYPALFIDIEWTRYGQTQLTLLFSLADLHDLIYQPPRFNPPPPRPQAVFGHLHHRRQHIPNNRRRAVACAEAAEDSMARPVRRQRPHRSAEGCVATVPPPAETDTPRRRRPSPARITFRVSIIEHA